MKHDQSVTISGIDSRGFVYALAPYLRKQEWQLERLENQLAQANRLLEAAQERRGQLDADFDLQKKSLSTWMHPNPNPHAYQRGLLYLTHLRGEMKRQDQHIEALALQRQALRAECMAQQLRLDGVVEHRLGELREYSNNQARLSAAETDRDWVGWTALVRSADHGGGV